jgi:transaldolase
MKFFADTADMAELKELDDMGLISGVTTNPSIISRNGTDAVAILREISKAFPDFPVFGQVVSAEAGGMIEDAKILNGAGKNIVVKIPATTEAPRAIKRLKSLGIKTCATAVLTAAQGFLCAIAGADYVAPYTGQNDVIGFDGFETLRALCGAVRSSGLVTKILAASIKKPEEFIKCALAGADIVTMPRNVFIQAFEAPLPLTEHFMDKFLKDWNGAGCVLRGGD